MLQLLLSPDAWIALLTLIVQRTGQKRSPLVPITEPAAVSP